MQTISIHDIIYLHNLVARLNLKLSEPLCFFPHSIVTKAILILLIAIMAAQGN